MDTPISLLHVICMHNNTKADYTLLSREGQVHLPTFTFRVQVNQHVEEASGQSKKKAKHLAAKKMILKLFDDPKIIITEDRNVIIETLKDVDESVDIIENKLNCELNESTNGQSNLNKITTKPGQTMSGSWSELENPIGKLQEICMKKHWHPPIYDEVQSSGLPHERLFTFHCKIENMNLVVDGVGKSKKSAKREAAERMLTVLRDEHLDKVDEILDRIPKNTLLSKDHSEGSFNLRTEIIAFQENREKNRLAESNHYSFFKRINSDEKVITEIRQLVPDDMNEFIQKHLCDTVIENVDILMNRTAELIKCQAHCVLHPEKSQIDQYQYWAELIAIETSNNNKLPILSVWGTDDDLQTAKQKALSRLLITFLWYCCF
ncbi:RISC-loading complex subunit-like protein [Euroglyphus maynei]|uniref:RISC-loading complex subunit-like protein n=1 Tax=Euroglyphus maynei TaxID=6958 RepID=A0A1Y3B1K6_EURMA|nr:RISC-loading complex subunit-like protein [Euroglyphus maynei]